MSTPTRNGSASPLPAEARTGRGPAGALDRWLLNRIVATLGRPPVTFALWDGSTVAPEGESIGTITFKNRSILYRVIAFPEVGFGDGYSQGRIEISGDFVQVLYRGFAAIDEGGPHKFKRNLLGRLPRSRRNTRAASRKHIQQHYDLGNDFYQLWLDEGMVYTCAYYEAPGQTLEAAQAAKMDHVCRKVMLKPGMDVVEAGCGWGALAMHMAEYYGVKVKAFNISRQQIAFAREQARARGLDGRVEFIEDDYRNIGGKFDAFVSVGMLEHVGPDHYAELGSVVARVLKGDGLGIIHSVGRNRPTPPSAWLERRIFPGSYPPSLREMMDIFEPYNFCIMDVENLRLHYAQTLMAWLKRFEREIDTVRGMYDEYFVRAWRLYLGGCAAAFLSNSIQLFQVVFGFPAHNAVPLTRRHLYEQGDMPVWRF
jgi:cyclopropane-fatty-acyl-phospholipid synthase